MTQKETPTGAQPNKAKQTPHNNEEIPTSAREDSTSEHIDGEDITDETSEAASATARRPYGLWMLILFVVFTGTIASVSWYGWKLFTANANDINSQIKSQKSEQNTLSQSLKDTQNQVAQLTSQAGQTEKQLDKTREETQKSSKQLDGRMAALEKNLAGIQNKLGQGERAWKAAEIGFLLTRAQERLSISQDPAGAAVALKLADERLAALALPQTIPVRAAISDALAKLDKANDFDTVGMALRLRRAADNISQWPLIGTQSASTATAPTPTATEGTASTATTETPPWYVRWPHAIWRPVSDWFSQQFTLTRSDEPVKASARVSTDRETRLWLTAVREGLLSNNTPLMMRAITESQHWIKQHYVTDAVDVSQTLAALKTTQNFYSGRQWPSFSPIFKAWAASGLENPTPVTSPVSQKQEAQP